MISHISTGINGLDQVIDSLRLGDNVVWQVDAIEDYRRLALLFVRQALKDHRKMIYIRFASHPALIDADDSDLNVEVFNLQADHGFESFASELYQFITRAGHQVFYLFDCLSDLLDQWSSDLMIGNYFRITCPHLYKLDTVAYFALKRGAHSFDTIARIRETTQLLLDVYHQDHQDYVHPLKVWQRYSPTMFLPHKLENDTCTPLTNSTDTAVFFAGLNPFSYHAVRQIDYWDRLFLTAEQQYREQDPTLDITRQRLCGLLIDNEGKIGQISQLYFTLDDLLNIRKRQIGTGKIGGKAVGMLLARKIIDLKRSNDPILAQVELEPHDSFYLGSDLFYTYIVQNGWWKLRTEQKTSEGYFSKAHELREKLLRGKFPSSIREQFQQMLEYFGQSPIIVRSSSLLEDDFGNAFAGKYESVFCANQGSPEERYDAFEQAIRIVYASTMDESALEYRLKRGLNQKDEQMALLVQRVSGTYHGQYFYPMMAGVGHSNNLYVWNTRLNPQAGMLRLVFGLGTRAVDRVEGDYPRTVALDYPLMSAHETKEDQKTYSQHYVDLLDLSANKLTTIPLDELIKNSRRNQDDQALNLEDVGEIDWEATRHLEEIGIRNREQWIINFRKILSDKYMIEAMRTILQTLEGAYKYPVDIEFTINPSPRNQRMINILQCRPLQTKRIGPGVVFPDSYDMRNVYIRSYGHFMGGNVSLAFKYLIYVRSEKYVELTQQERYQVARMIGQLNHLIIDPQTAPTLLLGPGRWGTTTPSLGIPVKFSEISNIAALGEIAFRTAGMIPELSFGSHFFQDLVESDIFYMAILPYLSETVFQKELPEDLPNLFAHILPQYKDWENVISVYDFSQRGLVLFSDITSQQVLCLQTGQPLLMDDFS